MRRVLLIYYIERYFLCSSYARPVGFVSSSNFRARRVLWRDSLTPHKSSSVIDFVCKCAIYSTLFFVFVCVDVDLGLCVDWVRRRGGQKKIDCVCTKCRPVARKILSIISPCLGWGVVCFFGWSGDWWMEFIAWFGTVSTAHLFFGALGCYLYSNG